VFSSTSVAARKALGRLLGHHADAVLGEPHALTQHWPSAVAIGANDISGTRLPWGGRSGCRR
jgi:hypothetical protein